MSENDTEGIEVKELYEKLSRQVPLPIWSITELRTLVYLLDPRNIRLPVKVERATQGLLCPVILTSGDPSHWDSSRDKGGRQMLAIHGSSFCLQGRLLQP